MNALASQTTVAWTDADGGTHDGALLTASNGYDIVACTRCGFRHAVPLPTPDSLEHAYRDSYYADEKPTFLAHAGEDAEWAALAWRDRLETMETILAPQRRRLLDIGSGPGFFLKSAAERGWDARGIEPSRQAAAHARALDLTIVEGFFNAETASALGAFDAVHMNNVLEHVPNPAEIVRLAHAVLAPGGVLCLNVPNDFSPFQIAARAHLDGPAWWAAPPHHLNYFDFDSLSALMARAGFDIVSRTTSFPMEMFLLMGHDYTADAALGRRCHAQRKRFDMALEAAGLREARRAFYRALAEAGIGREAVLIGVKA